MDVKQCKMCKKLFQSLGQTHCLDCMEKLDDYFITVRDFLYSNPNAGIMEISENTGVDVKYVLEFIREDRLTLNSLSDVLKCERCGAEIRSGRYCKNCKTYMERTLQTAESKIAKQQEQDEKEEIKVNKERMFLKY